MMQAWAGGWWLCAVALAVSAALTRIAIVYAHRRGLLDHPGRRRSHKLSTPRGGGVGLVGGTLPVVAIALAWAPPYPASLVAAWIIAGLLVAAIGWLDDHHDTSARIRLLVQVLACVAFAGALVHGRHLAWAWLPILVLLATWSINLHNFMDGIDAILGLQVAFVGCALGMLALFVGQHALGLAAFATAAAAVGFLLFNWPPARIFMGDVGSGFAGFVVFALVALLASRVWLSLWPALILCSAFTVDAGLTLAWRMWCGKRWYTAHREHLYQWLVRCGSTHARTSVGYLLWDLAVAVPVAAWATWQPRRGLWLCLMVYAVAGGVWWIARRACIGKARSKGGRHVA